MTAHLAWHFCTDRDGHPVLLDGTPLEVGRWYEHAGSLVMCESGYHSSLRALDALSYSPGPWACLVLVDGERLDDSDKIVTRRRKALFAFDATEVLRLFARETALSVIHLWDAPQVVRDYLETGDEELRAAARAAAWAAWAAARDAARAAAWAAARAAARTTAWAAARDAARTTAWAAAWEAARDAARDAAWDERATTLEGLLVGEAIAQGLWDGEVAP